MSDYKHSQKNYVVYKLLTFMWIALEYYQKFHFISSQNTDLN